MLEIKTDKEKNVLLVEIDGVLDSHTASDFKSWVEEKIIEGYSAFGFNCKNLKYISSRGISSLIEISQILEKRKGHIGLFHVSPEVKNLLSFLQLNDKIPTAENSEAIVDRFVEPNYVEPEEESLASKTNKSHETDVTRPKQEEEIIVTLGEKTEPMTEKKPERQIDEEQAAPTPVSEGHNKALEYTSDGAGEKMEEAATTTPEVESKVIACPNCGIKLRVTKAATYLCPECRTKFKTG